MDNGKNQERKILWKIFGGNGHIKITQREHKNSTHRKCFLRLVLAYSDCIEPKSDGDFMCTYYGKVRQFYIILFNLRFDKISRAM